MPNPPVLWDIESDPALAGTKLLAEAWDAAGLYEVGSFAGDAWKEWNGRFRDDVRDFFRGQPGAVRQVAWIKLRDPKGTLNYMVGAGLIDSDEPQTSPLLMKPTMQVEHVGGQKMVVGDRACKQFRRFIDDYAAVVQGKYAKAEQLPEASDEVSLVTVIWLKIEGVPAKYDKLLLQADLYRQTDSGWSEFRVATSDRPVFGKGNLWQHSLSLTAPRGSKWAEEMRSERLPPGVYLVKRYVDQMGKLEKDFTAEFGEEDFVVEIESRWPAGYGRMTVVKFPAE